MLSVEEALLMKAVQEEIENQEAASLATGLGAGGGALLGAAAGTVPHKLGNAVNNLRGRNRKNVARTLKPGYRMAGGLTGLILGGGLGAGMAAMMKRDSQAGDLLGKIQAQRGQLEAIDEAKLAHLLGNIYQNPSQLM